MFQLADGSCISESGWNDGAIPRDKIQTLLAEAGVTRSRSAERASKIQRMLAATAASLNELVPPEAGREELTDMHAALHKLQQLAAGLCG